MKSISTLTWSCFITEKPVHFEKHFWKSRMYHYDMRDTQNVKQKPWLWITKVWIKKLMFSCVEGLLQGWWLSTFTTRRTWKAKYFAQGDLTSCKIPSCPVSIIHVEVLLQSMGLWDTGLGFRILKATSMENSVDRENHIEVIFNELLVPLIGEAYRPIGSPSDEWGLKPVTSQRLFFWTYFCCVVTHCRTISSPMY